VPERVFDLSTAVPVAPAAVLDFLLDLNRHHGLHPFLVRAEVVDEGTSAEGEWRQWRVLERPRLGPLRYPISFGARLTRTSETSFRSDVRAAPGCTISATTDAMERAGGSLVTEHAVVQARRPVLGYLAGQAQVAHTRTFRLLPAALA
jgi:hypothetical protein